MIKKENTTKTQNPYERIFDDANRRLRDMVDSGFLDHLEKPSEDHSIKIPFPYGGKGSRADGWK